MHLTTPKLRIDSTIIVVGLTVEHGRTIEKVLCWLIQAQYARPNLVISADSSAHQYLIGHRAGLIELPIERLQKRLEVKRKREAAAETSTLPGA